MYPAQCVDDDRLGACDVVAVADADVVLQPALLDTVLTVTDSVNRFELGITTRLPS